MERKWKRNGTEMEIKWKGKGMERGWKRNGKEMEENDKEVEGKGGEGNGKGNGIRKGKGNHMCAQSSRKMLAETPVVQWGPNTSVH